MPATRVTEERFLAELRVGPTDTAIAARLGVKQQAVSRRRQRLEKAGKWPDRIPGVTSDPDEPDDNELIRRIQAGEDLPQMPAARRKELTQIAKIQADAALALRRAEALEPPPGPTWEEMWEILRYVFSQFRIRMEPWPEAREQVRVTDRVLGEWLANRFRGRLEGPDDGDAD